MLVSASKLKVKLKLLVKGAASKVVVLGAPVKASLLANILRRSAGCVKACTKIGSETRAKVSTKGAASIRALCTGLWVSSAVVSSWRHRRHVSARGAVYLRLCLLYGLLHAHKAAHELSWHQHVAV